MLIKQSQERNAQLQLLMENKDLKASNQLFQSPPPHMQPNTASAAGSPLPTKAISPYQHMIGNMTPTSFAPSAGPIPIMPRTNPKDNLALKKNAQIKQQLFIQKINQKQAQARQNTNEVFTQQDIDNLLSANSHAPNNGQTFNEGTIYSIKVQKICRSSSTLKMSSLHPQFHLNQLNPP
jgi:hypothetical protein